MMNRLGDSSSPATILWSVLEQSNPALVTQIRAALGSAGASAQEMQRTLALAQQRGESPIDIANLLTLSRKAQMLPAALAAAQAPNATDAQVAAYYQLEADVVDIAANYYTNQSFKRNAQLFEQSRTQRTLPASVGTESSFGFTPVRDVFGNIQSFNPVFRQIGEATSFPTNVPPLGERGETGQILRALASDVKDITFSFPEKIEGLQTEIQRAYDWALTPARALHNFVGNQVVRAVPELSSDPRVRGYYRPGELAQLLGDIERNPDNPTLFDKLYQGFTRVLEAAGTAQRKAIPWLAWVFGTLAATGQLEARIIRVQPGQPLSPADQAYVKDIYLRTLTASTETSEILVLRSKDDRRALDAVFMFSAEQNSAQLRSSVDWERLAAQLQGKPVPVDSKTTASPPYAVMVPPGGLGPNSNMVLATGTHYTPRFFPFGLPSVMSIKYDIGLNTGTTSANLHTTGAIFVNNTPSVRSNPVMLAVGPDGVSMRNLALIQPPGSFIFAQGTYIGPIGLFYQRDMGPIVQLGAGKVELPIRGTTAQPTFKFLAPSAKNFKIPAIVYNPGFKPADFTRWLGEPPEPPRGQSALPKQP